MNDLALDLAVKAGYTDRGNGSYKNFDLEKYAELIVQECIRCCDDVDVIQKHYLKYHMDMELGAGHCIEVIKKHFGISDGNT